VFIKSLFFSDVDVTYDDVGTNCNEKTSMTPATELVNRNKEEV